VTEKLLFGEWLRKKRRALDMSRQALADQAGCAEITLRRIEGGTLKPSKELAAILLEKVGIPKSELDSWIQFARGHSGLPSSETKTVEPQQKTNLPAALTSLIGREKELADIMGLLERHRLVTLVGTGGVGKTRLSIKVGEHQISSFRDGVWLVELAPLTDPNLIEQTINSALGIPLTGAIPVIEIIINYLRSRTALLILDNCEHLLDASAQLTDILLKNCPQLKILVTSREAMGIMGEATYIVPALTLPNENEIMDTFRDFGSVRLFEERAQLAKFDFSLTMENASFVAQICHRLDGIPLALELAAVQLGQFSPAEIAEKLEDSFRILTGGSRTALPRQQTIRASIDWSWDLLSEDERVLLRRLSVFAGGWTLEAAQAVCGGESLALINSLVKKSLVGANQDSGSKKRFVFHEVIRQYAHEKLIEAGEAELHQKAHLDYFVSMAERADVQLHVIDQTFWFEWLGNELPNLRAALGFSYKHNSVAAIRLSGALGWFWYRRGLLAEGRSWYEKILGVRQMDGLSADIFSKAFYGAGLIAHFQADYVYARKMLEQSLMLAQQQENLNGMAHAHAMLGLAFVWQGDFLKAEQHALESIEIFRTSGGGWGHAFALNTVGFAALLRGDYARAQPAFEESVSRARAAGDRYISSYPLSNLGIMAYQQGNLVQGRELLEESLAIGQEAQDPTEIEWCMTELGHIARLQGDFARATELFEAALEHSQTMGLETGVAVTSRGLGDVAVRIGEYQKAQALFRKSLILFESHGDVRNVIYCLRSFAALASAISVWDLAVKLLAVVDSQLKAMGISMSPVDQISFDEIVDEVRRTMSELEFDRLWRRGAEIPLPDAIALILSDFG